MTITGKLRCKTKSPLCVCFFFLILKYLTGLSVFTLGKCCKLVVVVVVQSILDTKKGKPSLKITEDVNFKNYILMTPFFSQLPASHVCECYGLAACYPPSQEETADSMLQVWNDFGLMVGYGVLRFLSFY